MFQKFDYKCVDSNNNQSHVPAKKTIARIFTNGALHQ